MRPFRTAFAIAVSLTILNVASADEIYQVTSSHREDLELFQNDVETVSKQGRLWLVRPKNETARAKIARILRLPRFQGLRPAKRERLKHYAPKIGRAETDALKEVVPTELIQSVSATRIKADVEHLSGSYGDRSAGSDENRAATEWLKSQMTAMQMSTTESCYTPGRCSVVAERVGSTLPNEIILVMAHFDSVGKPFAGADDNASGSAALLEMARVLGPKANRRTWRFFFTNGEEVNLSGAQHYARQLESSGDIRKIVLGINMDMVGYNSNGIVELETNAEYDGLANWFATLAQKHTTLRSKITLGAWGSDHVPFLERGVPTLLTIEDWTTKTPCYHQRCDKPDTMNYAYAAEVTKLNVAAVLTKDAQ